MTQPLRLDGVFSVLPTAFHEDGGLDLEGTAALVRAARDAGVTGLTVLGVMGEAAELSEAERVDVLACVGETAAALPIVVGVSGETAALVATRARDAARGATSSPGTSRPMRGS